jgi:excisionase family DNA binding protein
VNKVPGERRQQENASARITIPEISRRLNVGRQTVYLMLQQGIIPGLRVGRRWLVTKYSYETWERTCGLRGGAGLGGKPELDLFN